MSEQYALGVDIGGTKMLSGFVDTQGHVIPLEKVSTPQDLDELLERCNEILVRARENAPGEIVAAGFGVPFLMDTRKGVALHATHHNAVNVPFAKLLHERLALPVVVDNDSNLAALAEHRLGAARGFHQAVVFSLGTGIGGGLIINDQLYRGATGAAGELGYITVDADGPLPFRSSTPEARGLLETLASGSALGRLAQRIASEKPGSALAAVLASGEELDGSTATKLALDGDAAAREAVAEVGRWLGVGIASCINIFNPEVVAVAGGVSTAAELLLGPAREEAAKLSLPGVYEEAKIVMADFGPEAGMIGAALLALESCDNIKTGWAT